MNKTIHLFNIVLFVTILSFCTSARAVTRTVALDGSQQYTTIQAAINASANGDIVLVYPGRYLENVTTNGRNITLASLEHTTGDALYINNTVIDGNQNGSCIRSNSGESNVTIRGFTITNGSGFLYNVYDKYGGGIFFNNNGTNNNINIINCVLHDNFAYFGGAIYATTCNLNLQGVTVNNNNAFYGGGVYYYSNVNSSYIIAFNAINRCNIYNNYAVFGTDICIGGKRYVHIVTNIFTVLNPDNYYIYLDNSLISGHPSTSFTYDILNAVHTEINQDLYVSPYGNDDNSGLNPSEPMKTIAKAIYKIKSDSLNPKTVHLLPGVYSKLQNGQLFPFSTKSYMRLIGDSPETTILDGEGVPGSNQGVYQLISSLIQNKMVHYANFTIRNAKAGIRAWHTNTAVFDNIVFRDVNYSDNTPFYTNILDSLTVSNVLIENLHYHNHQGGIYCSSRSIRSIILKNITIRNVMSYNYDAAIRINAAGHAVLDNIRIDNVTNNSDGGNAIIILSPFQINNEISNFTFNLRNSCFSNVTQIFQPSPFWNFPHLGFLRSNGGISYITNCTFADNAYPQGSFLLRLDGDIVLTNNIFYNPSLPYELGIPNSVPYGFVHNITLRNNCIRNGMNGILNASPLNQIIWGEGNVSVNPQFAYTGNHPYRLSHNSLLIDAGISDTGGLGLGEFDLAGNERIWDGNEDGEARIDIGAYEYQPLIPPFNLGADVTDNMVTLNWSMPQDLFRASSGAVLRSHCGFRVYRDSVCIAEIPDVHARSYLDTVAQSDTLSYYVTAIYGDIDSPPTNTVTVVVIVTGVSDYQMAQAVKLTVSPNPFRALAVLHYILPKASDIRIAVYNVKGEKVKTLENGRQGKGANSTHWDGSDEQNNKVGAGIYFLRMTIDGRQIPTRKITYIK